MDFNRAVAWLFDFERPEVRLRATIALLVAALVSPYFTIVSSLPAIRIEQVLLALFLVPLYLYARRHPEARKFGVGDVVFLALPVAIALSVAFAPILVPEVRRSYRDLFDLLRPLQYWLLFRVAITCEPTDRTSRRLVQSLWVVAILWGVLSFVQYMNPFDYDNVVTKIWAKGHDLDGVIRDGRVVGTIANADVLAVIAALIFFSAFWYLVLTRPSRRRFFWFAVIALGSSIYAIVLAQSRGATIAALAGVIVGGFTVVVTRRRARWILPLVLSVVFAASSVGFLLAVPSAFHTFTTRFNPTQVSSDPSVVLRVARIRLLFGQGGEQQDTAALCNGSQPAPQPASHTPTGSSQPSGAAATRDAQRKQDVATISTAIARYYCANKKWPSGDVASALASVGLSQIPTDPSGGQYQIQIDNGYEVSARLENTADPDGPVYMATSKPNMILNSSFDQTNQNGPTDWLWDGKTTVTPVPQARFGSEAAHVVFSEEGFIYQYSVYSLPEATNFSASMWLRSSNGKTQTLRFYQTEILADGSRISPAAEQKVTLPADGSWVHAMTTFKTPDVGLVYIVQLLVQPPYKTFGDITVDAASLTEGSVAPAYQLARDVNPVTLSSGQPSFFRSPVIGLGPLKVLEVGGDPGEYLLMLLKYGILGLAGYLALFLTIFLLAIQAWRRSESITSVLALTLISSTALGAVFAITAAIYLNYQVMDIFWPIAGVVAAVARFGAVPAPAAVAAPASAGGAPPDREPPDREPPDREPPDREPPDREPPDREPQQTPA